MEENKNGRNRETLRKLLETESKNLVSPKLITFKEFELNMRRSKYPYGLGKEWEF